VRGRHAPRGEPLRFGHVGNATERSGFRAVGPGSGGGYGAGGGATNQGGGGGGSSFEAAGATNVFPPTLSTRTGDGQVTISYDPATDSCSTPVAAAPIVVPPSFTG